MLLRWCCCTYIPTREYYPLRVCERCVVQLVYTIDFFYGYNRQHERRDSKEEDELVLLALFLLLLLAVVPGII